MCEYVRMTVENMAKRTLLQMEAKASKEQKLMVRDPVIYGGLLRELREASAIGLNQIARLINRSPAFVSDCERGRRNLNQKDAAKFVIACITANLVQK